MKSEVIISISRKLQNNNNNNNSYFPVLDDYQYIDLARMTASAGLLRGELNEKSDIFTIRCDVSNPKLQEIYAYLINAGWTPNVGYISGGSHDRFSVRTVRTYTDKDLIDVEFFSSICFQGIFFLEEHDALDSSGWTASGIESNEGRDLRVASLGHYTYFVRSDLKNALEKEGLAGLEFRPLRWSVTNEDTVGEYWELQTKNVMPRCLLPVVWMDDRLQFEENGYDPAELHYSRDAVEGMGTFDVAWSTEELGNPEKRFWGKNIMIFSRKFRQILISEGVDQGAVRLTPVRLDSFS